MDRIGRYSILKEIGRGAMGVVYSASDPSIGRTVAIKTIRLNDLADGSERAKLRDRLFREAQSAGMLSHPHIVTIYDVAEEGGLAYIAMELVEGLTLDQRARQGGLNGKDVLSLLAQMASALDYAHHRGIVHRDIKPANILIHEGKTAKIADFGVAKFQSHEATQAGSMIGTPNYMSREQIQGQSVDGRSDQFSLAVIAYELLTGQKPFQSDSMPSLVFKIVNDEPAPVQTLNPRLTWPVDTVVKRGLAKNPGDRYPTCSDFAFALENACRPSKDWKPATAAATVEAPTLVPGAAPVVQAKEPVSKALRIARVLALIVLAAGIISALMVGGLEFLGQRETPSAEVKDETVEKPAPVERTVITPPEPEKAAESLPGEAVPVAPAVGPAMTRLITNPPGADLTVDGSGGLTCKSPCSQELAAGRHTLSATMAGHRRTLKIFETPQETEIFLNLERMTGSILVRSEPPGAIISVDGQQRAERTPAMFSLPVGKHSIEAMREGVRDSQEVEIRDGSVTNLTLQLQ